MAAIQDENVQLCLTILKQMAGMVQDARRAFGSNDACVVNRRELAGMIDQLYHALPDAVEGAMKLMQTEKAIREQTDQELSDLKAATQAEAQRALNAAQQEAQQLHAQNQQDRAKADFERQSMIQQATAQANAIVQNAHRQASDIVAEAQQKAERLASKENVYQMAEAAAATIQEDAHRWEEERRQQTYGYMSDMLTELDRFLANLSEGVRVERSELNKHRNA